MASLYSLLVFDLKGNDEDLSGNNRVTGGVGDLMRHLHLTLHLLPLLGHSSQKCSQLHGDQPLSKVTLRALGLPNHLN